MATNQSQFVLQGLQGQTMRIPNLDPVFNKWVQGTNPLYDKLAKDLNQIIDTFVVDTEYAKKLRKADLAMFVCRCYPEAEWERLQVMGQYMVWLFVWDDSIDKEIDLDPCHSGGDIASDLEKADLYRARSVEFIKQQLQVLSDLPQVQPPTRECEIFRKVATPITKAAGQINISQLSHSLQCFIDSNSIEQRFRLSGRMPTVGEYWSYRHGTGAIDAICSLSQYIMDTNLPEDLSWNEHVTTLHREAGINTILLNDLLSLRKEMNDVTPLSYIPILIQDKGKSLDEAVEYTVKELYLSAERFNSAAEALRNKSKNFSREFQEQTNRFIRAFEGFQTGVYSWTIGSPRYGIKDCMQRDNCFSIIL